MQPSEAPLEFHHHLDPPCHATAFQLWSDRQKPKPPAEASGVSGSSEGVGVTTAVFKQQLGDFNKVFVCGNQYRRW